MKRTGCLQWATMILLRAELATHLPTKDIALNGDILAAANISIFGVSRPAISRLPLETSRTQQRNLVPSLGGLSSTQYKLLVVPLICTAAMLQVTICILGVALSLFITSTDYELKIDYMHIYRNAALCTLSTYKTPPRHICTSLVI